MTESVNVSSAPMRTLVTGGAGFLGSHLCDRLITEGHEVMCIDNLLTGRVENIQHLWEHPRFAFILHDATTPLDLDELEAKAGPKFSGSRNGAGKRLDYILHLRHQPAPGTTHAILFTP